MARLLTITSRIYTHLVSNISTKQYYIQICLELQEAYIQGQCKSNIYVSVNEMYEIIHMILTVNIASYSTCSMA